MELHRQMVFKRPRGSFLLVKRTAHCDFISPLLPLMAYNGKLWLLLNIHREALG
jgi:hypothetical protein